MRIRYCVSKIQIKRHTLARARNSGLSLLTYFDFETTYLVHDVEKVSSEKFSVRSIKKTNYFTIVLQTQAQHQPLSHMSLVTIKEFKQL